MATLATWYHRCNAVTLFVILKLFLFPLELYCRQSVFIWLLNAKQFVTHRLANYQTAKKIMHTVPTRFMCLKWAINIFLSFCFLFIYLSLCPCNVLQGFGSSCLAFRSKPSCENTPDNFCEIIINCPGYCIYSHKVHMLHPQKNFSCFLQVVALIRSCPFKLCIGNGTVYAVKYSR